MKTLNKNQTTQFFTRPEGYDELINEWKTLKNPNAHCHMLYAILRGKDWRKGFTPITNTVKLTNGQQPDQAKDKAWNDLRYRDLPFGKDLLVPNVKDLIRNLVDINSGYKESLLGSSN